MPEKLMANFMVSFSYYMPGFAQDARPKKDHDKDYPREQKPIGYATVALERLLPPICECIQHGIFPEREPGNAASFAAIAFPGPALPAAAANGKGEITNRYRPAKQRR